MMSSSPSLLLLFAVPRVGLVPAVLTAAAAEAAAAVLLLEPYRNLGQKSSQLSEIARCCIYIIIRDRKKEV